MAYDEGLATRVREMLGDQPGLAEQQMFGWLLVAGEGHAEGDDLRRWVDRGVADAASLPPKGP